MTKYNKALVALVGVAVTLGLIDDGLAQDLIGLGTAVLVFLVPNAD